MPYKDYEEHKRRVAVNVTALRKRRKLEAVKYLGGKCVRCGYNRNVAALVFHHPDPSQKEFAISAKGLTRSWEKVKLELDKCILLCANCHAEVHNSVPG